MHEQTDLNCYNETKNLLFIGQNMHKKQLNTFTNSIFRSKMANGFIFY